MKATKRMMADAEKDGGEVTDIKKVQKLPAKPDAISNVAMPHPAKNGEIKALRAEISELRAMVKESQSAGDRRVQELSAIITALSDTKPVRVKPVRDLDPASKTYLLVSHYDFIPVSYKRLDS